MIHRPAAVFPNRHDCSVSKLNRNVKDLSRFTPAEKDTGIPQRTVQYPLQMQTRGVPNPAFIKKI
jgi:hypothetical protein